MELAGKVAVVTGGASGIGRATVTELRRKGAVPVVWDVEPQCDVIACDVSSPDSVAAAMRSTVDRFGVPQLLVNAAGTFSAGPLDRIAPDEWQRVFAVNATGAYLVVAEAVRRLREANLEGSLVLVGSVNALLADPLLGAYSASKAAVVEFGRVAAVELGRYGIRVNVVCPGTTATPMIAHASAPAFRAEVAEHTPLGRMGEPTDIAETIVCLLGLSWVTGQILAADGGSSLASARGAKRRAAIESDREGAVA